MVTATLEKPGGSSCDSEILFEAFNKKGTMCPYRSMQFYKMFIAALFLIAEKQKQHKAHQQPSG